MNPLDDLPRLRDVADAFSLRARKSLGQNFLFDENVLDRIARSAGNLEGAVVVEIGPGPGGLTRAVLRAGARRVLAIEMDRRCCAALSGLRDAAAGRLAIHEGDALECDLRQILEPESVVMGNLPFNSSTRLAMRLIEHRHMIDRMILMFQKEVAERLVAAPGTRQYGRLSVLVQWLCRVEWCFGIDSASFVPAPKVRAAVVRITPRGTPLSPAPEPVLRALTQAGFGQRRKVLRNALGTVSRDPQDLLHCAGLDPRARAEDVDVASWCALAREHAKRTATKS
ncbi:MAG: 16S rRNA (adenine(1518)-N(6)/adenine(1519)-N(6))-dimethyltransferase RsmA [bacterium]|nr:16S rRNA (adenine(1518)-N(6)/adenine(1519)-N(6))-dimethyltransferase RsmA [bacterium]